MNASQESIAALLELQKADLAVLQAKRALEGLPQRKAILDARAKRAGLEEKRVQVDGLVAKAEDRIRSIEDESDRLTAKKHEIQTAIDEAKGDYRNLESRTKELEGIAKRERALEDDLDEASAQLEKAESVRDQIDRACAALDAQEQREIASFREEGGALQERIGKETARRQALHAALPDDLAALYDKTAERSGGVAVALLSGSSCGACRSSISHERLIEIKREAPLSTCPACKRILVVAG